MLEVQKYLHSGKTIEDLNEELGIKATFHATLPLVILNYSQIDSPKSHPIVRECRSLILDSRDWSIVSKSMDRFFNWGEMQDEMSSFDFSDFIVQTKEDGSLAHLFWFDGEWHVSTRGSFAVDCMQDVDMSWEQGMCNALGVHLLSELDPILDRTVSYIMEFCSPWNKVVRRYAEPRMFLLTAFRGQDELTPEEVDRLAEAGGRRFNRPQRFEFKSIEEIQDYLSGLVTDDPTYEGVVICDKNFRRWKIKNSSYLALHRLKGEGGNLFNPKHLLPFVLAGEESELLCYFNEVSDYFFKLKCQVQELYITLMETWADYRHIESQKEFALAIKDKPFSSILFGLRKKMGQNQTSAHLRKAWRESEDLILKMIKRS